MDRKGGYAHTPNCFGSRRGGWEKFTPLAGHLLCKGPGLTTVEIYDPDSDAWTDSPEMPTARVFLGVGTIVNKIYAVGGVAEGLGPAILPTVEQFAPGGLSVAALDKFLTALGEN